MSLLGLKLKLGFFPKTEKIEKKYNALCNDYQKFVECSQSEELNRFEYLNKYLNSSEFEEKENNPEIDKAEISAPKKEFAALKKSPQLIWYFKNKAKEARFIPVKSWDIVFEDDFANQLDTQKWESGSQWGNKIVSDGLSLGEQHYLTNGKNISVVHSILSIETRREKTQGKMWTPPFGFAAYEFPYTSGAINTKNAFRHQYGKIEAKIKVPKGNVSHSFWLGGEGMLPQVNIFKYTGGKFFLGHIWGDMTKANGVHKDHEAISGAFAGKSYIFTLEWTPKQLTWSINGEVFKTASQGIPAEPMYIGFSSGIDAGVNINSLPNNVKLEIDWVKFSVKA